MYLANLRIGIPSGEMKNWRAIRLAEANGVEYIFTAMIFGANGFWLCDTLNTMYVKLANMGHRVDKWNQRLSNIFVVLFKNLQQNLRYILTFSISTCNFAFHNSSYPRSAQEPRGPLHLIWSDQMSKYQI